MGLVGLMPVAPLRGEDNWLFRLTNTLKWALIIRKICGAENEKASVVIAVNTVPFMHMAACQRLVTRLYLLSAE